MRVYMSVNCSFRVLQNIKPTSLLCVSTGLWSLIIRPYEKVLLVSSTSRGKKSTFLHIHRRIKYLGRKSSLLQMDTYRTKMGNFCAALLVASIARIHLVADLKFSLEFLSCYHWWKYNSQCGWGWGPQVNSRSGGIIKWAGKTPELAALYMLLPAWNLTQDGSQSFWVRFSHKSQITFTTR